MKISFITTVLNEGKSISNFLDSLLNQSKKPDEVLIVDGGSRDETIKKIKDYKAKFEKMGIKFGYFTKKGNRSVGRNLAIKKSSFEIIACTDSGNILSKDWLEKITNSFKKTNVDVVAGFYKPIYESLLGKCIASYTCFPEDKIDDSFLPSSRSIAFRKNAWHKVKGYPEHLNTCEDLVFAKKLKNSGAVFKIEKKAIVKWKQVENILPFARQIFLYAKGDGEANFIRTSALLLFGRYILALYLIFLSVLYKSFFTEIVLFLLFILYIIWSILKNYRYVNNRIAIIFLPILQLISDVAVVLGTFIGFVFIQSRNVFPFIKKEKFLVLVLIIYSITGLFFLRWGTPNEHHPFPYHMDEWHQLNAVRSTFAYGTPNIEGSANGTMLHFIVSGIYMIPFTLIGWINLVDIEINNVVGRMRIFDLLRLNTLFFGALSIIMLFKIINFLKGSKKIALAIFTFSPIWLLLSGYFKYDIALIFWMLLSFFMILRFTKEPNSRNFLLAAIPSALAVSVKISAVPILVIYVISFFIFGKWVRNIGYLFIGVLLFGLIVLLFGMPDLLFGKGNISEYLYNNIFETPKITHNVNLPLPTNLYLLVINYPAVFGYGLIISALFSLLYWSRVIIKEGAKKYKGELFIIASLFIFQASLFPLGIKAAGNRSLVLLPFFVIIISLTFKKISKNKGFKSLLKIFILMVFLVQFFQVFFWLHVKFSPSPQKIASLWIKENLREDSIIGVENIPIYQSLPDVLQKEYYYNAYGFGSNNKYQYKNINIEKKEVYEFIVISNDDIEKKLFKTSLKNDLAERIKNENFKKIITFSPNLTFYKIFSDEIDFYTSNLITVPLSISIYTK